MAVMYGSSWDTGTTPYATSYTTNVIWPYAANTTGSSIQYVYRLDNGTDWISNTSPATVITINSWQVYEQDTYQQVAPPPPITQEEADRRLRETRERQHRNAIRRKRAVRKGQRLLLSLLSEVQKWEYAKEGRFTVCGADGELYVLRKGGTVHQLGKNGVPEWSHCIHLPYSYIDEDTLVSIKLMLETDPLNFHRIANTTRLTRAGVNVSNVPASMAASLAALAGGMTTITEHLRRLSTVAEEARRSADRLHRAIEYASYAREFEQEVQAEKVGIILPLNARQHVVAEALGHAETIAGEAVAA